MKVHASNQAWRTMFALALLGTTACGAPEEVSFVGRTNGSYTVSRGADFVIVLQTIGPGSFSDPTVSSASVRFVNVTQAALAVPAGPTQEFHFHAESAGQAIVVFQHTGSNAAVTDTVIVR